MIIGMYYLTAARDGFPGEGRVFHASVKDALERVSTLARTSTSRLKHLCACYA